MPAALKYGTKKDRFLEYLREDLLPCLNKFNIVVIYNPKARHTKSVEELLRSVGTVPLYLFPYSPDFTPIEKMWSKGMLFGMRNRETQWTSNQRKA